MKRILEKYSFLVQNRGDLEKIIKKFVKMEYHPQKDKKGGIKK